jgi:phenylacetate-coenzyme A ligase PaaK-like adenylate-forming protein
MKTTSLDRWIWDKHGLDTEDRKAVARYQLEKIQVLFDEAKKHSKGYRALYQDFETPATWEDFKRLPTILERDLVERPHDFLCVNPKEISRIVTLETSGTTKAPKRVFFTQEDIHLTLDFFHHGMKTMCGAGDRALILFPAKTPDSVGALLSTALTRLGLTVLASTVEEAPALFSVHPFDLVCGPASWVVDAASKTKGMSVRSVLTSSELLDRSMRDCLQKWWGADVFDHYGMTETGLGGAVECEAHQGMHIRENDLYFEIIGDKGELFVTTLTRRGMPFIRYRTGDRAVITTERCPCGSQIPRILSVRRQSS